MDAPLRKVSCLYQYFIFGLFCEELDLDISANRQIFAGFKKFIFFDLIENLNRIIFESLQLHFH